MSSSKITTKEVIETTERYPVQHEEYIHTFGGVKTMSIPFTSRTKKVVVKHHYFRDSYEEEENKELEDTNPFLPYSPKTRNTRRNNIVTLSSSNERSIPSKSQRSNLISSYILKTATPERTYNVVTTRTTANRSKGKISQNKYEIRNPFKKNERYSEEYYPSQRVVTLSSEYYHSTHPNKQNETIYIYSPKFEGTPERIETNPDYVAENIHLLTNTPYEDDAYKTNCIIQIQSCYRGHLTRKSLYENLRYFYRIHNSSEIITSLFDKHYMRLFFRKMGDYVLYRNRFYLKKIVKIDINNLPWYYKRNIKFALIRKDRGEAFQVIRKKIGKNGNEHNNYYSEIQNVVYNVTNDPHVKNEADLYKTKLQNRILKQLLIMKLQKEEKNLKNYFKRWEGNDKERYKELLKKNKGKQLKNVLKKKIDKEENELKRNFTKFFYKGVMREMTMSQEERDALQAQKKLRQLVKTKSIKESNTDKSKAFKTFHLNGLVKELKNANSKTKEQQNQINLQNKTIEDLRNSIKQTSTEPIQPPSDIPSSEDISKLRRRSLKKLINNKIKDNNKFMHDQFMKFYYRGLYKYMVHDKPKEDLLKMEQLQKELNEVKEQKNIQQQQQVAAKPQPQPQEKFVPKKSLEIEIPADNISNNNALKELTNSAKNKAKELRKLIRNKGKSNREKLRKYFDKMYMNGIIRSLKNAPKILSQNSTPVNKEHISIQTQSQVPEQRKSEEELEKERIEMEKERKQREKEDNIRKRLDKLVYYIDRNNLLVSKSVFSKWNLRTKLLRLKETKGKKKKKKSVSPSNKTNKTSLPKVNAFRLKPLTPSSKSNQDIMPMSETVDNNEDEIVIGPVEVKEETSEVAKPLRSRARIPKREEKDEGMDTNNIEYLKYLLEEYEEEEEDDEDYEEGGENGEINEEVVGEVEMPTISEVPEIDGMKGENIHQNIPPTNIGSVPIKKVMTTPINTASLNSATNIQSIPQNTLSSTNDIIPQKPTRSRAPNKLRASKKPSIPIKPSTEDIQIQTEPFDTVFKMVSTVPELQIPSSYANKLPQSYISPPVQGSESSEVQLPKDVEELEKKELIALFTFGFLCSFFLLFQQG